MSRHTLLNINLSFFTLIIRNYICVADKIGAYPPNEYKYVYQYTILFELFNYKYDKTFKIKKEEKKSFKLITEVSKRYLLDSNVWESKYKILFLHYYKISSYGVKDKYRFIEHKGKSIDKPVITKHYISSDDIKKEYNGNKWFVPVNYTIE